MTPVDFPPLNLERSPFTGWTRDHWEAVFARLTCGYAIAAERSGSPARALFPDDRRNLPDATDALESFARMASAWGAWLGNPSNPAVVSFEGRDMDIEAMLRQALLDGTNAANPHTYWGDMNHMSQHIVEAADIAAAIWHSRDRVFFKMTEAERAQVMGWLGQVDGKGTYPDNWVLFAAMAQTVRLKLGYLDHTDELDFRLAQTRAFYHGDGWYVDGEADEFELYNAWMFGWHYLLWTLIDGDRLPDHKQDVLDRARSFIDGFQHFFGSNGSYPAWGRSIVYRFAAVAVFATGYLNKVTPDDPGMLRRISSGCIRYFYDHGMFDPNDHHLRQGYHGDFPAAGESYISPGSPYWACHGLFALILDRDDPFWTAIETPLPVERDDFDIALPAPGFVISGRKETGQVILLNSRSGIDYDSPRYNYSSKYSKFSYSTHFPFNVLAAGGTWSSVGSWAADAMIALMGDDNRFGHRQTTRHAGVAPGMMWCDFNEMVHGEPQKIRAAIALWGNVQIRMAWLLPTVPVRAVEAPGALGCNGAACITRSSDTSAGWEYAEAEGRALAIRRLYGYDTQQPSAPFMGFSNINLAYPYAEQPIVGESTFNVMPRGVASASLLRPGSFDPGNTLNGIDASCDTEGTFTITLPDGSTIFAALGFAPRKTATIGGIEVHGDGLCCISIASGAAAICATGIRQVSGVIELSAASPLHLRHKSNGVIQVTTGSGLAFSPGWVGRTASRIEVKALGGGWQDVTARCGAYDIPAELVQDWAARNQRTLVDFQVTL